MTEMMVSTKNLKAWPTGTYKTIYADPPWDERGAGRNKRGADRHYPLMETADIKALPVEGLIHEEGAHLYLWVTNNHLPDGLEVLDAWGFRYITIITWEKIKDGQVQLGLGQYVQGSTEHCLFGVSKRRVLPYRYISGLKQRGRTLIITAERGKHSRKPAEMRAMIEKVSYTPRIELFAREVCVGWDAWGDEVP